MDEKNMRIEFISYSELDIEKVQTIEDIKLILGALKMTIRNDSPDYEKLKHFLKTVE